MPDKPRIYGCDLRIKNGLRIYARGSSVIGLDEVASRDTGEINLTKSDAYANEIVCFVDCVKNNRPANKAKSNELELVIDILK